MGLGWERVWISRSFLFIYLLLFGSNEVFGGPTRPQLSAEPEVPRLVPAEYQRTKLIERAPKILSAIAKNDAKLGWHMYINARIDTGCFKSQETSFIEEEKVVKVIWRFQKSSKILKCQSKEELLENLKIEIPPHVHVNEKMIQILSHDGWQDVAKEKL